MGRYREAPLSNFPDDYCHLSRMTDPDATLLSLIVEYNKQASLGNVSECQNIIRNNPRLADCQFSTMRMNQLLDEIVATQKFYMDEVHTFIENIAGHKIGLSDDRVNGIVNGTVAESSLSNTTTLTEKGLVKVVEGKLSSKLKLTPLQIPNNKWVKKTGVSYDLFENTVAVAKAKEEDNIELFTNPTSSDLQMIDVYEENFGYIKSGVVKNGSIVFQATKQPTMTLNVIVKGVS